MSVLSKLLAKRQPRVAAANAVATHQASAPSTTATAPKAKTGVWVADVSSFARALAKANATHWQEHNKAPSHTQWLNQIAKAAGFQNYQSLRALEPERPALSTTVTSAANDASTAEPVILTAAAQKTLHQFDVYGRLTRLPKKLSIQQLAVWCLWTRITAKRVYTEPQINEVLKAYNTFGDHVSLRREMVEMGLLNRKSDCSEYRKGTVKPSTEIHQMIQAYLARSQPIES